MIRVTHLLPFAIASALLTTGPAGAQEATPTATPGPVDISRCSNEPRNVLAFAPVARQLTRPYIPPVEIPMTLPEGKPADPATVAEVHEVVEAATACFNAGDALRLTALMTDGESRRLLFVGFGQGIQATRDLGDPTAYATTEEVFELFLTVSPVPDFVRFRLLDIRDIRELPDGRVAAVVVRTSIATGQRSTVTLFERRGDGLLIAKEAPYLDH